MDTGNEHDSPTAPTKTVPGWARVLGAAAAIGLVILVVVLHLTGVLGPGTN